MAVEPVTSQKTTVTVLRTSWRPGGTRGAAHAGQNAKSSGDSRPQLAQVSTSGAYATGIPRTNGEPSVKRFEPLPHLRRKSPSPEPIDIELG